MSRDKGQVKMLKTGEEEEEEPKEIIVMEVFKICHKY